MNSTAGSDTLWPWLGPPVIMVSGAVKSTVQVRVIDEFGFSPSLPFSVNVYCPSASPLYATLPDVPVPHAAGVAPVRWHVNVVCSLEANVNATLPWVKEPLAGPLLIVSAGGSVSTVHVRVTVGLSRNPSLARSRTVCEPSLRLVRLSAGPQALRVVLSSEQNRLAVSFALKVNDADLVFTREPSAGPPPSVATGAIVSTVTFWLA